MTGHPLRSPLPYLLVAIGVALSIPTLLQAQDASIPLGSQAPRSVSVETLDGKTVELGQYIGKTPVVLEFWATWCPLCRELEPKMHAAYAAHGGQVRFVGIAVSVNESAERVRAYAEKHRFSWEVLFDRKGTATSAFDVLATSTIVVLDRTGRVVYTGQGSDQDIEAAVRKAL